MKRALAWCVLLSAPVGYLTMTVVTALHGDWTLLGVAAVAAFIVAIVWAAVFA